MFWSAQPHGYENILGPLTTILVPVVTALGVKPGLVLRFRSDRNNAMPFPVRLFTPSAATRTGMFWMLIEPLSNAGFEGDGFRIRWSLPAIKLDDSGALVEKHSPVFW